jgi:hypothetical protein
MTSPRRNFLAGKARALPHKTLRPLALFGLFLLGLMFWFAAVTDSRQNLCWFPFDAFCHCPFTSDAIPGLYPRLLPL